MYSNRNVVTFCETKSYNINMLKTHTYKHKIVYDKVCIHIRKMFEIEEHFLILCVISVSQPPSEKI